MVKKEPDESPADLGEMESEEDFDFPPAERRVITQPVDLSVQTLVEQWDNKQLILPDIQREYLWDDGKASRLIESLILNIPIPVLYFAETPEAKYEIIDGHQRVQSIVRYMHNEFNLTGLAVLREYRSLRLHKLPEREQRFLKMRTLRAIIISVDSHPTMKFEIFERLNSGSISLNAQELRNSIYRGPFNNLLHDLVKKTQFRSLIGTKTPRKRMVDEELLLRFFALRSHLDNYRTPLKKFLNNYAATARQFTDENLAEQTQTFNDTVSKVSTILGRIAFRILDPNGNPLENAVNRALFDAQMLAASWSQNEISTSTADRAKNQIASLYSDGSFLDSIQRATGDRSRTLKRLRETVGALTRAGLNVNVPFDLSK